jgi:hypothetical protein
MIPAIGKSGPIASLLEGEAAARMLELPSLTYRLDWEHRRITGRIDALEAVKQAAVKVLQTERYEFLIYSTDYGTEWNLVLGKERLLVRSELQRIVSEALLQDERIRGLEDAEITFNGDHVSFSCTVVTDYGNFELRKEWDNSV